MNSTISSIDPSTGRAIEKVAQYATEEEVERIVTAATRAAANFRTSGRDLRASVLRAIDVELEARSEEIVSTGVRETGLLEGRLRGELARTRYQARLFADVVEEGGFLEATIDHPKDSSMGPMPDLRRLLVPLGPVAVFGPSNFPLAFGVPGGDTVSAIAAGCPVVIKAHSSHPALSLLTYEALTRAAQNAGAPEGTFGLIFGEEAARSLVAHPEIKAVGFTGSGNGGKALMDVINARPDPIPFYGELSSLNPVLLTKASAESRRDELVKGMVSSISGSGGQLCTKPGVVLIPYGAEGDTFVKAAARELQNTAGQTLLNEGIARSYSSITEELASNEAVRHLASGLQPAGGFSGTAELFETDAASLGHKVMAVECFGPTTILVRYHDHEIPDVIDALPGSLTATIHAEDSDSAHVEELVRLLQPKTGRLLFSGWPTGVAVTWAQHHGGPWPSTNTVHSSVGTTAVRRFQRPQTWQSAPAYLLPEELRDEYMRIPRRVDGVLQTA